MLGGDDSEDVFTSKSDDMVAIFSVFMCFLFRDFIFLLVGLSF